MCKTYHMRFHEQKDIVIPEDRIHWDYKGFMNDEIIKPYIDDYILSKIVNYMPQTVKDNPNIFKNIDPNNTVDTNFRPPI